MSSRVKGFVCYCPELRLYWHKTSDLDNPESDTDYKFDDDQLLGAIESYLSTGDDIKAKQMASMTGLARLHPHKFITFDVEKDKIDIVEPSSFLPPKTDDDDGA